MERQLRMVSADNRLNAKLSRIYQTLCSIQRDNRNDHDIIDVECLDRFQDKGSQHFIEKPIISSGASKVLKPALHRTIHGAICGAVEHYLDEETEVGNVIAQCVLLFLDVEMMEFHVLNNPLMSVQIKFVVDARELAQKRPQQVITAGQKDIFVDNRANMFVDGGPAGDFEGYPNFEHFINCYRDSVLGIKDLIKETNNFRNERISGKEMRNKLSKQPHLSRILIEYDYFYERDDSKLAAIPDPDDEDEDEDIEVECRIMEAITTVAATKYDSLLRIMTHDHDTPVLTVESVILPDQELMMSGIQQELLVLSEENEADENKMGLIKAQYCNFVALKRQLSADRELNDVRRTILGQMTTPAPALAFAGWPRGAVTQQPAHPYIMVCGIGNNPHWTEGKMVEINVTNAKSNPEDRWMILHKFHGIVSKWHDKLLIGMPAEVDRNKHYRKYVRIYRDEAKNIVCARVTAEVLWNYAHTYIAERTPKHYEAAPGITMEEFIKMQTYFDIIQFLSAEPFSCNQHSVYQAYLFTVGKGVLSDEFTVILKMSMMKKVGEIMMERRYKKYYTAVCVYFNTKELKDLDTVAFIANFRRRVRLNRMRRKILFASHSMVGKLQTAYITGLEYEETDQESENVKYTEEFARMDEEEVEDFYGFWPF